MVSFPAVLRNAAFIRNPPLDTKGGLLESPYRRNFGIQDDTTCNVEKGELSGRLVEAYRI